MKTDVKKITARLRVKLFNCDVNDADVIVRLHAPHAVGVGGVGVGKTPGGEVLRLVGGSQVELAASRAFLQTFSVDNVVIKL